MTMQLAHLGGPVLAPVQLGPIFAVALLYAMRVRALAMTPRAVPGWRQACFFGGLTLIVLTLASPIGHVAEELFWVHMTEHLLIADIGALMLVLGTTGPLLAPVLRVRWLAWLRVLSHPLVALPLWALDFYAWHLPALYQAAVRYPAVHALEHFAFVSFGAAMWMALLGPLPKPPWFGNAARLLYIVAVRLIGSVLANVILWDDKVLYRDYRPGERYWGISAHSDQVVAGSVMMVEGSIVTICLFCWLFLRAAREGEERQELLDYAASRGVELEDRRAARAVAAGRGADLRKRIGRDSPDAGEG
ncbi:MAG: putative rane protein [Thermoleophilaceae bacterium]|jgi:cytochrome c oxidase assembly factor CtaG|nr:putative rane protein [Thermoleophilaceae bacterium]